jgi:hypothetical protein
MIPTMNNKLWNGALLLMLASISDAHYWNPSSGLLKAVAGLSCGALGLAALCLAACSGMAHHEMTK